MVQGFLCYGVPIGQPRFVEGALHAKAQAVVDSIDRAVAALQTPSRQSLATVLRLSCSHEFDYWLALSYPSDIEGPAAMVDAAMWRAAAAAYGGTSAGRTVTCSEPFSEESVVQQRLRLPMRLKGLGLRSCVDLAPIAFMGGLAQAVPHFVARPAVPGLRVEGLMPHLRPIVGLDSFTQESGQWRVLLQAGVRTGRELKLAHTRFRAAVQDARGQPGIPVLGGAGFAPLAGDVDPSQREVRNLAGKT